ncbi:MAG TPA: hypothetical protein VFX31_09905, partial [Ktedonobacterales bacterium]|nr:hypothetical protein [Ktedonobacterales bacterium]
MTQASGRPVEPVSAAPTGPDAPGAAQATMNPQAREALLAAVAAYMDDEQTRHMRETLTLASDTFAHAPAEVAAPTRRALADALRTATILAEGLRSDVVTLAAVLLEPLVEAKALAPREIPHRLGKAVGGQVAHAIGAIERFDALHRPGATLRRQA